jgi:hypothetical protein
MNFTSLLVQRTITGDPKSYHETFTVGVRSTLGGIFDRGMVCTMLMPRLDAMDGIYHTAANRKGERIQNMLTIVV